MYLFLYWWYIECVALNIRNENTLDALRQLATITGQPMTSELELAVTERLERLRTRKAQRLTRLERICQETAQRWPADQRTGDPTAILYDDSGIPA